MRRLNLTTVCEEAACPNIGECWTKKHATVMILGDTCTRACAFCNVKTGMPRAVDPLRAASTSPMPRRELGLEHIVITSVDRDDLPDGGAQPVRQGDRGAAPRRRRTTTIEILTPDFRNKMQAAVEAIVAARPDVYNHNLETVPRLYPTIRPGARYYASLRLLESVKRHDPSIFTKSGVMLGLGEERLEVHQVMDDMRCADIDFLTMGQYLQPTPRHAKVMDFVTPAGVRRLCRDRARQGLPAGRVEPADAVELSCRRRFRGDARRARGAAGRSGAALMPGIRETRRLPYSAEQMFDLVADVGALCRVPALGQRRCACARTARPRWSPT